MIFFIASKQWAEWQPKREISDRKLRKAFFSAEIMQDMGQQEGQACSLTCAQRHATAELRTLKCLSKEQPTVQSKEMLGLSSN